MAFLKRLVLCGIAFALIFIIPTISVNFGDNFELIGKYFVGEKCEYQGFIEVWNIDTFEAGTKSKTEIIKQAVSVFQNSNRGLFVMVRNLLPNECLNLLANGERPDLFSCGYRFAEEIKEYVCEFENFDLSAVYENYKNAGKSGEKQIAVAWCGGAYFFISTADKLNSAKINIEDKKLSNVIFDSGFEKKVGKNKKIIYSVGFGSGDYICPKNCLDAYIKKGQIFSSFAFDEKKKVSTYGAYADFLSGSSTILLGTQRDMVRIETRLKNNKISNVIFEPVKEYNDLVQFFFKTKNENKLREKYAQKFASFMLSANVQESIYETGLIAVVDGAKRNKNNSVMSNITPEIIRGFKLENVL